MSLTDNDRRVIAEARELAALRGSDAMRAFLTASGTMKAGERDEMVYPVAFGHARWLLGELAAIAGRLAGAQDLAAAALELAERWQQFAAPGDTQDECADELRAVISRFAPQGTDPR